ncbi:MAG: glycosyltransferase [Rudaea sp.]
MRRIVYFTDSSDFGGTERVLLTQIGALDRNLWQPILMYHAGAGIAPLVDGAHRLGAETIAVPRMIGRQGATQLGGFIRRLRAMKPEVFHAHLTMPLACKYGLAGAALAGVPAVVASEHLFVDMPLRYSILVERIVSLGVDRYVAVSDEVARRLRERLSFPASKMKVVHNGIPLEPFEEPATAPLRSLLDPGGRRPIVLTLARLTRQKGLDYLLEAAARVPEALFAVAGEGPERARLEKHAEELRIADRVTFLGNRPDVAQLLLDCEVFVLPSLFEGLPLSVLEAMAAGKPVIATDVGGTREVVAPFQTGLLVPPGDVDALSSALCTLLADKSLARRLGEAGRARARSDFSAERMSREMTGIYDEILSSKGVR